MKIVVNVAETPMYKGIDAYLDVSEKSNRIVTLWAMSVTFELETKMI